MLGRCWRVREPRDGELWGRVPHFRAMTALPLPPQRLPLTVADYVLLGEDPEGARYELQDGNLVMVASPIPEHQICIDELMHQLRGSVPPGHRAIIDIDIDLQWCLRRGPERSVGPTSWS